MLATLTLNLVNTQSSTEKVRVFAYLVVLLNFRQSNGTFAFTYK
jgi:hypothetical protein